MQCPGLRAVLSRRRGGPPCTARGTRGCGHDGRRVPRRSPGGSPCYGGTTRPARHRRARAGSRLAPGRSTRRRRRCTCTTGTAPLGQPLPPRAPPLRRRDGFLAFLVGLGDGPRVGHVTPLRPEGPGSYLGPLHLCHAESTEPTCSPSTWTSTPPISGGIPTAAYKGSIASRPTPASWACSPSSAACASACSASWRSWRRTPCGTNSARLPGARAGGHRQALAFAAASLGDRVLRCPPHDQAPRGHGLPRLARRRFSRALGGMWCTSAAGGRARARDDEIIDGRDEGRVIVTLDADFARMLATAGARPVAGVAPHRGPGRRRATDPGAAASADRRRSPRWQHRQRDRSGCPRPTDARAVNSRTKRTDPSDPTSPKRTRVAPHHC